MSLKPHKNKVVKQVFFFLRKNELFVPKKKVKTISINYIKFKRILKKNLLLNETSVKRS